MAVNRHRPTGTPWIGLALGAFTALMWGTLPVVLKILVRWLDAWTITWFRFLIAGLLLLPLARRSLGTLGRLRRLAWVLLALSTVGLTGNYLTFMGSLNFVSPETAQIVIQLSPVFMLLGGLLIFGESFSRLQWSGVVLLLAGQVLFFQPRFDVLLHDVGHQGLGVGMLVLSALLWGLYMLTQKQLLQDLRAETVLVVIYLAGSTLMLPVAAPARTLDLPALGWGLLVASSVMTMVSYFTFATALHHVEASRIGVLVALTPIIVMVNVQILAWWQPGLLEPDRLGAVSLAGAVLVVCGSVLSALGGRRR